jgi:ferredoxin-NADP reductase
MLSATNAGVCSVVNTFVTSFPPAVVRDVAEGTMAFHFEKPPGGWALRVGFQFKSGHFVSLTLLNPPEIDAAMPGPFP